MIEQPDLTLVRFFEPERYVLQRADGQELAVLSHGVPGDGSINGRAVRLTVSQRGRRPAIAARDERAELGYIQLSWVPGRYRIQLGEHSTVRVAKRWLRGGWTLWLDGGRIATLELNGWFRSGLSLVGAGQREAGHVVMEEHLLLDADVAVALVLVFEMIHYDIPVPVASAGG